MPKESSKSVNMRAFKINNPDPTKYCSGIRASLEKKLNTVIAKDRGMILNTNDLKQEQILISNFDSNDYKQSLFCTMLKMEVTDSVQQVTDKLLNSQKFKLEELDRQTIQSVGVYKEHFYFSVLNDYVVTALLPLNRTIKPLQTYLSWFLKDEKIELYPMIEKIDDYKFCDLKTAVFDDSSVRRSSTNTASASENTIGNKVKQISVELLKSLFKESDDFSEISQLESIVSAQLLIKFNKPKKMTDDDYQKVLGASLKSIGDLEDVQFKTKDNKKIVSGLDLHKYKEVKIELTSNGSIIEEQLKQEMAHFLNELCQ